MMVADMLAFLIFFAAMLYLDRKFPPTRGRRPKR